jgi:nucleotide-binding universal stress UspA family protein
MFEEEDEAENSLQYLESLKTEMEEKGISGIECITELGDDLIDCMGRLAYQKNIELIIMGISEKEEWKQLIYGSKTLKMAEENICPVMIIPPGASFSGMQNIALASDFKDVLNTTPVLSIKTVLEMFRANLHVVNVDSRHYVSLTEEYLRERGNMQTLFAEFNPEFYFIGTGNFEDTITQFASDKRIDLIIVIPRSRSFLDNILGGSHTKKLAFNTTVPLLAAHQ